MYCIYLNKDGEQDIRVAVMLEHGRFAELTAVAQDTFLGKQAVDPVQPLLRVAAAALEDQALLFGHAV